MLLKKKEELNPEIKMVLPLASQLFVDRVISVHLIHARIKESSIFGGLWTLSGLCIFRSIVILKLFGVPHQLVIKH